EDVVRKAVAGMAQRSVARRVEALERKVDAERPSGAFDTGTLHRYAHPCIALANQLGMCGGPIRRRIEPAADVQPFDDHRAVEALRIDRPVDENARFVSGAVSMSRGPPAVGVELAAVRAGLRRAGHEELGLRAADIRASDTR